MRCSYENGKRSAAPCRVGGATGVILLGAIVPALVGAPAPAGAPSAPAPEKPAKEEAAHKARQGPVAAFVQAARAADTDKARYLVKAANQPGALGTAAKVALDEEQAPARQAAVKLLGTLDVRWWPEVEADLIAALRTDRNESVRLEAALVLAQGHCCTKKTRAALQIAADGSDKDGNPAETSARVQKAAREALKVCDFKLNHKTASVVGAGRTR